MDASKCPGCGSFDIEQTAALDVDAVTFCSVCHCNKCGAEFHQLFTLASVEIIKKG